MADEVRTSYDVVIIGGGPAGLTAAIYASRARLSTLLIEKMSPGGQVMMCENIENYPGYVSGSSGWELCSGMQKQAEEFGTQILISEVAELDLNGPAKSIRFTDGSEMTARAIILSLGAKPRRLGVPGEREFIGRGVSYCAVCDGALFKDKNIVVVGGGDTAVEDAAFLARFGREVTIVHRRDAFRAQRIIQERTLAHPLVKVRWNSIVKRIGGSEMVESVVLEDVRSHQNEELPADGVFVLIGLDPNTALVRDLIELDEMGYIVTDENMHTSVPGVFAAGDVRRKLLRQIVTACADGAIAATAAEKYIEGMPEL